MHVFWRHARREVFVVRLVGAQVGGGEDRIKAQHDKGKFTARERIDRILDPASGAVLKRRIDPSDRSLGAEDLAEPADHGFDLFFGGFVVVMLDL